MICLLLIFALGIIFFESEGFAGDIYRWVDEKGTIIFSDSPPPQGSFKKQKVEDEIDKTVEKVKQVDKDADLSDQERLDEKGRILFEQEKKTKAIKDYDQMRLELRLLDEKLEKKLKDLYDNRGHMLRQDYSEEVRRLRREHKEEARKIREHYGYY